MWFTEFDADRIGRIGRISRAGALTQFRVPTPKAGPYQIAAGPQRTMWFTEYNPTMIGRVSADGRITEFRLPRPTYRGTGITGSPAGHVLVAEPAGYIDSAAADGTVTRTRVASRFGFPFAIARLPDGTIWLNELTGYYEYSRHLLGFRPGASRPQIITLPSPDGDIVALAAGPAGSLWVADFGTSTVGEIRATGRVSQFALGQAGAGLSDITAGPDAAMWMSAQDGTIARITADGIITELALPGRQQSGRHRSGTGALTLGRRDWRRRDRRDNAGRRQVAAAAACITVLARGRAGHPGQRGRSLFTETGPSVGTSLTFAFG